MVYRGYFDLFWRLLGIEKDVVLWRFPLLAIFIFGEIVNPLSHRTHYYKEQVTRQLKIDPSPSGRQNNRTLLQGVRADLWYRLHPHAGHGLCWRPRDGQSARLWSVWAALRHVLPSRSVSTVISSQYHHLHLRGLLCFRSSGVETSGQSVKETYDGMLEGDICNDSHQSRNYQ